MENITTSTTSKFGTINLGDLLRGLLMAVGMAVLTIIQNSIAANDWTFDWKNIGTVAAGTAIVYLIKNLLTPSTVVVTPAPGESVESVKKEIDNAVEDINAKK